MTKYLLQVCILGGGWRYSAYTCKKQLALRRSNMKKVLRNRLIQ